MFKSFLLAGVAATLLAGAATAADLPRRVAPPPVFTPVPVFTWTGFYGGLHTDTPSPTASASPRSATT